MIRDLCFFCIVVGIEIYELYFFFEHLVYNVASLCAVAVVAAGLPRLALTFL